MPCQRARISWAKERIVQGDMSRLPVSVHFRNFVVSGILLLWLAIPTAASDPVLVDEFAHSGRSLHIYVADEAIAILIEDEDALEAFLLDRTRSAQLAALIDQASNRTKALSPGGREEIDTMELVNSFSVYAARTASGESFVGLGIFNPKTDSLALFPLWTENVTRFQNSLLRAMSSFGWAPGGMVLGRPDTPARAGSGLAEVEFDYAYAGEIYGRTDEGRRLKFYYDEMRTRIEDENGREISIDEIPKGTRLKISFTENERRRRNASVIRVKGQE